MSTIVVALGGNAILQPGQRGTAEEQLQNVRLTCRRITQMVGAGHRVVITHGNGPQVGNILLQNEEAGHVVPPMPLDVLGAQSQGMIGYMIQQCLYNELEAAGLRVPVATVVTQVVVDPQDRAFLNPSKPIGPFYTERRARRVMAEKGVTMKEDAGRGWRRVVPSPDPKYIFERPVIAKLVTEGFIVIASGGGGVPVVVEDGKLHGVEAVIDKDLAGERLARDLEADLFMILTDVPGVAVNYGRPDQRWLNAVTAAELRRLYEEGHFRPGSMGPKVEAALRFVSGRQRRAVITSLDEAYRALTGEAGTQVVP